MVLGMILDKMSLNGERERLINSPAFEVTCLRIYAVWKAYDGVRSFSDWQSPKNQNGPKWKSKVDWRLAQTGDSGGSYE